MDVLFNYSKGLRKFFLMDCTIIIKKSDLCYVFVFLQTTVANKNNKNGLGKT
jgi:hypothetical protein